MIFADLRIRFLNWLAKPAKTTFTNAYKKEKEMSYAINTGPYTLGGSGGSISITPSQPAINVNSSSAINFSVAKATGGWIVQINKNNSNHGGTMAELYIIADDANFDSELGKIVTMSCLKND